MNIRISVTATASLILTACGGSATSVQSSGVIAPPVQRLPAGMDRVMGRDARSLIQMFGTPAQDVREETARKLQFSGTCILDAYLYPPSKGKEAVVTYLSARLPDGRDTDQQACVSQLARGR